MEMKSMKLEAEEAGEYSQPTAIADRAEYPYGLRIRLDDASLRKLAISELPKVGSSMIINAKAKVCATGANDINGESESYLELQITDMGVSAIREAHAAQSLYGDD